MGERGSKEVPKNSKKVKSYFADTNFYLRFILKDNIRQVKKVKELLFKAKKRKVKIIFLPQVILEMEFVLRSVYSLSKEEIVEYLFPLVKIDYLEIGERQIWLTAFKIFKEKNLSLFDIFLFLKAKNEGAEILSFDKDFKKLARSLK